MQFEFGVNGWSETHYYNSENLTDLVDSNGVAKQPLSDLLTARKNLMPFNPTPLEGGIVLGNPRLIRTRVSQISLLPQVGVPPPFRSVRIFEPPNIQDTFGGYPGDNLQGRVVRTGVETWTRLELLAHVIKGGNPYEGHIFLGGAPESILAEPEIYNPTDQWNGYLTAYMVLLGNGQWMTRIRQRRNDPPVPQPITQAIINAATGLSLSVQPVPTGAPAVPNQGYQVVVRGRHPSEWNGVRAASTQTNASGTFCVLGPSRQPLGDWAPAGPPSTSGPGMGTIQFYAPVYAPYNTFVAEGFTHRDDGGPFGRRLGRRRRTR
jgi:hypothetical protein